MENQARYHQAGRKMQDLPEFRLSGLRAFGAFLFCAVPLCLGFILPIFILVSLASRGGHDPFTERYVTLVWNSVSLAGLASVLAVGLALLMAYAQRLVPGVLTNLANRVVSLGYALPGSIVAVGILIPLATFDNVVDAWMEATFGIDTGLLLTGSIAALIFGYLVRFMAVALNTVDAALTKVTERMDDAARALGCGPGGTLVRIHAPLLRGSLLTAGLIVFVDVMKELPATLIMRPFNFDTLAVQAYRLASDERLTQAATPALMIVAVGILPVVILSRQIMRSRPGRG
ncbi:MAG: ABC transporter permease subunit [Pseudomonadota bacterium]